MGYGGSMKHLDLLLFERIILVHDIIGDIRIKCDIEQVDEHV